MIFYTVIVIYNKNYKQSESFKTAVLNINKTHIILCDNSTKDYRNSEVVNEYPDVVYNDMNGNIGLSKAYNRAIDTIPDNDCFVVIFDDDTSIPIDYYDKFKTEIIDNPNYSIYVPLIYDSVGLLSPNIMKKNYNHRANSLSDIRTCDLCAINSGMVIRRSLFKQIRYNEKQFLDYVDFSFIRDAKAIGESIKVVDSVVLQQDFSATIYDRGKELKRFLILKKDLKVYYEKSKIYYLYIILRRKIKLCLKYRTVSFLFK